MRIFKNKWFTKFARKERISDKQLYALIKDLEKGVIDVGYGSGVIKQRLARPSQGKSSGYRCIILFRLKKKAFFVYGFPKNERDNISQEEEKVFKELSEQVFHFSEEEIDQLLLTGALVEVDYE
ncbi:MAG: type II toxin-antitoxin system RelE/ParE family toxin [Gammaproteobacteria bacterium]|nr:type II toxin-antitoxin system RelE/ParE family toxin [Gammaproteobacteria bacterium]